MNRRIQKCEVGNGQRSDSPRYARFRSSGFRVRIGLRSVAMLVALPLSVGISRARGGFDIPPLLPPRGELSPGFWEQHGWELGILSVIVGAVAITAWRLWLRPRAVPAVPPAALARRELEKLRGRHEDAALLGEIAGLTRHYFLRILPPPEEALTDKELSDRLLSGDMLEPELAQAAAEFFDLCQQRRFSPGETRPGIDPVNCALDLIDRADSWLQRPKDATPLQEKHHTA